MHVDHVCRILRFIYLDITLIVLSYGSTTTHTLLFYTYLITVITTHTRCRPTLFFPAVDQGSPGNPGKPSFPRGPLSPGSPGNPGKPSFPRRPLGPTFPLEPVLPLSPGGPGCPFNEIKNVNWYMKQD